MASWYVLAIVSTLLNGLRAFLTKRAAQEPSPDVVTRIIPPAVMVVLGGIVLAYAVNSVGPGIADLVMAATVQGALFYIAALSRWEALRLRTPSHVLFPIVQASTPVLVVLSAILFQEWSVLRTPQHLGGVVIAILATYVLADWKSLSAGSGRGVAFASVAMLASTGATLAAKFAFEANTQSSIFVFIVISNSVGLLLGLCHSVVVNRVSFQRLSARQFAMAICLGMLNFFALAAFLRAIKLGDLVVVASIGALSAVVPIVLSVAWDGEVLKGRQHAAVAMSIVALLLLA